MKLKISRPFWQVLGIGALAGMRTSSAPVIASHILSARHHSRLAHSPLNFMQSRKVAGALKVLSLTELVMDKLPSTPNRIRPAGVVFRCLSGALAGASIYKASGNNVATGAALGIASAFAATYLSFALRRGTVKHTHIIDPIIGAIEDALVIGAGVGIVMS
jgi:uncharacterized membrane protein